MSGPLQRKDVSDTEDSTGMKKAAHDLLQGMKRKYGGGARKHVSFHDFRSVEQLSMKIGRLESKLTTFDELPDDVKNIRKGLLDAKSRLQRSFSFGNKQIVQF